MQQEILVTGATGNIGSILVPQLAGLNGVSVRALTRDPANAREFAECGAQIAAGRFDDEASLVAAADGVDTLILIVPPSAECVAHNRNIISAAKKAGVRKIVRVSAIKAAEDGPTENTRLHGECDRLLQESGLAYTILRPNYFMQNIFMSLESIKADDVFYAGTGDGRLAMIDVRDVVDCAVAAATSTDFDNQALEIGGPESISFSDVAATISEVVSRQVAYVGISPEDLEGALLQMGFDAWTAGLLREYSTVYGQGWGDLVTDGVQRLTGKPARSFRQFAAEVLAPALA
jgi:uncharacterized protein YbjT (DUF2867 family)